MPSSAQRSQTDSLFNKGIETLIEFDDRDTLPAAVESRSHTVTPKAEATEHEYDGEEYQNDGPEVQLDGDNYDYEDDTHNEQHNLDLDAYEDQEDQSREYDGCKGESYHYVRQYEEEDEEYANERPRVTEAPDTHSTRSYHEEDNDNDTDTDDHLQPIPRNDICRSPPNYMTLVSPPRATARRNSPAHSIHRSSIRRRRRMTTNQLPLNPEPRIYISGLPYLVPRHRLLDALLNDIFADYNITHISGLKLRGRGNVKGNYCFVTMSSMAECYRAIDEFHMVRSPWNWKGRLLVHRSRVKSSLARIKSVMAKEWYGEYEDNDWLAG